MNFVAAYITTMTKRVNVDAPPRIVLTLVYPLILNAGTSRANESILRKKLFICQGRLFLDPAAFAGIFSLFLTF